MKVSFEIFSTFVNKNAEEKVLGGYILSEKYPKMCCCCRIPPNFDILTQPGHG